MVSLAEGKLLWTPSADFKRASHMARYMDWLAKERGAHLRRLRRAVAMVGR
jgi:hypothetical protein